jgi:hypothetical protein
MSYCAPAATLAALAARAFARFATSAAFRAGDSFLFGKAFFTAAFFAFFAAWNAAQRFLVASEIAFLPAALILRFGFAVTGDDGDSVWPLDSAHRFRCASPMRFLAAALMFRRLGFVGSGVAEADCAGPAESMERSSAICVSIWSFCCSKPTMAALMISGVSCFGMCDVMFFLILSILLSLLVPYYTCPVIDSRADHLSCVSAVTVGGIDFGVELSSRDG